MEKLGTYSKARGRWKGGKDREGQSFFPLADPRPKKRKGKEGWALHSSRTRRAKEFTHEEVLGWWFVRTTTPTNSRSKATTRTDDGAWACLSCGIRAMLEKEALRKERMRWCSRCRFKILTARFLFLLEYEDFCFTRAHRDEPNENHFGEDAKTIVGDHFGRQN